MSFEGFEPAAVALLAEAPAWDAATYDRHRERLRTGVVVPARELIAEIAARLDGKLTVLPRGSVSPLSADLRFAAPGAPRYKDHLLLTTWRGEAKATAAILWIRLGPEQVGFASGVRLPTPALRDRWRAAVAEPDGERLADEVGRLVAERGAEVTGEQLSRVPRPYPADHPRADLLRRKSFQVRWAEPLPEVIGDAGFADWCTERVGALLGVHSWLVAHVVDHAENDPPDS